MIIVNVINVFRLGMGPSILILIKNQVELKQRETLEWLSPVSMKK